MRILRATHLGWCFGVRDAVRLVHRAAHNTSVTVLGELVHNDQVNADLRDRGVRLTRHLDEVRTDTVIITAHGLSETALAQAKDRVPRVLEATCPLVHAAHRAVRELVAAGYHPVIVGQRDHVEVRGLTDDLAACDIVLTEADVAQVAERPRFGVAAQTTQPLARVRQLTDRLRERFPRSEVRLVDTVCLPTKQRQEAAIALAEECDLVVVVGGAASNNTAELAATCRQYCPCVVRVEAAAELQAAWFAGAETVGLTAGTSTPDEVIVGVENWLRRLAAERSGVNEREVSTPTVERVA